MTAVWSSVIMVFRAKRRRSSAAGAGLCGAADVRVTARRLPVPVNETASLGAVPALLSRVPIFHSRLTEFATHAALVHRCVSCSPGLFPQLTLVAIPLPQEGIPETTADFVPISAAGAPTQEAPASRDLDVLGSTWRHRLEERGVRFCETSGKFPHVPRGGEDRGDAMAARIGQGDCGLRRVG